VNRRGSLFKSFKYGVHRYRCTHVEHIHTYMYSVDSDYMYMYVCTYVHIHVAE